MTRFERLLEGRILPADNPLCGDPTQNRMIVPTDEERLRMADEEWEHAGESE